MKKRALILFSLLCLAIFPSCGKKIAPKQITLLLDWWPNPNHVPIFVGKHEEIFEKYGIDLKILTLSDMHESIPMLLSKQADIVLYYMPNTIKAAEQIPDLRVLGIYIASPLNVFLFREDSGIQDQIDFQQKILGRFTNGIIASYVESVMRHMGIKFSEIKRVEADLSASLLLKNVDIITGVYWNIEGAQFNALGVKTRYLPLSAFHIPDYFELVFLSHDSFLKHSPGFAERFQKAVQESIDFCQNNPERAFDLYCKMNPEKDESTRAWEAVAWKNTVEVFPHSQYFYPDTWILFQKWMLENQLLGAPVEIRKLLEYSPKHSSTQYTP